MKLVTTITLKNPKILKINMKKDNKIFIGIIIVVIIIISIIMFVRGNTDLDDVTAKCISENSILVVSKTCSHCAQQKRILGDHLETFNVNDITDSQELIDKYNIQVVPTWIINNKVHTGVKSINDLKELTGC